MIELITQYRGYAYFFFMLFVIVILYGYMAHLYRAQKKGIRDYEKYGNLALDDDLNSKPIEEIEEKKKES
jgi:cytochrome c oxidase cbb3-type subunit IV